MENNKKEKKFVYSSVSKTIQMLEKWADAIRILFALGGVATFIVMQTLLPSSYSQVMMVAGIAVAIFDTICGFLFGALLQGFAVLIRVTARQRIEE